MATDIIGQPISEQETKALYQEAVDNSMSRMQLALIRGAGAMESLEEALAIARSSQYSALGTVFPAVRDVKTNLRDFLVLVHPENLKGAQKEFQDLCNVFEKSVAGPQKDENCAGRVTAKIGMTICQIAGDYI